MNKRFGKIDSEGRFSYADDFVKIGKRVYWNPKDDLRFSVGEREVVDVRPENREGFSIVFSGVEVEKDVYMTEREPTWTDEDGTEHGGEEYEVLDKRGRIVFQYRYEPVTPSMPSIEEYDAAMEEHLRKTRFERGYTTREPDSYLSSSVERWAQDARDWVAFKDKVMLYALGVENAVAGGGDIPTIDEFVKGLPEIEWTIKDKE